MRTIAAAISLAITALTAAAQVDLELLLDQEQLLRSESLPIRLRIRNFSGQDIKLDEQAGWLNFKIESEDGKVLSRAGEVPVPKLLKIESSRTVSLRVDLMPYFGLSQAGHYTVSARVRIPQLEKEFSTETKSFDIISGTKLWEREFGVPGHTPPEIRKYTLQQADFLKQLRLYVRVSDHTDSKVFRVASLGPVVSFSASTIEAQLDPSNNLHVLFQNGRSSFLYSVVEPDGEQIIRQTHEQTASRPHLKVETDGRIMVLGGQRHFLLSDLPPSRVANTNDTSERR